jgi:hypothetical protein
MAWLRAARAESVKKAAPVRTLLRIRRFRCLADVPTDVGARRDAQATVGEATRARVARAAATFSSGGRRTLAQ